MYFFIQLEDFAKYIAGNASDMKDKAKQLIRDWTNCNA